MNKHNYIGIDTSLSSTGMYILTTENKEFYFNYKNTSKLTKWHKVLSFVKYTSYDNIKTDEYGTTEIAKLLNYDNITNKMIEDIKTSLTEEQIKNTIVITEGYSYSSSNTSSLIDLISYATMLRIKLLHMNILDFIIKPPSTLKMETGATTYEPIVKEVGGKNPRTEYSFKNKIGLSAGSFQKHDMFDALYDNEKININFKKALLEHKVDILKMKSIPKPIDDIVDAIFLVYTEVLKNEKITHYLDNTPSAHTKRKNKEKKKKK